MPDKRAWIRNALYTLDQAERTGISPGFDRLMEIWRGRGDIHTYEGAFWQLVRFGDEHIERLISAFSAEQNPNDRWLILEMITYIKSPAAINFLSERLQTEEPEMWGIAIGGLREIDTKESRRRLWEAASYTFSTPDITEQFQRILSGEQEIYTL